jgi:hypothetical protein
MVEQWTENPCVPGSIPGGTTKPKQQCLGFLFLISFLKAESDQVQKLLKNNTSELRPKTTNYFFFTTLYIRIKKQQKNKLFLTKILDTINGILLLCFIIL